MNGAAPTAISTLSLHDALPISFQLAKAGLLNGKAATTHHEFLDKLEKTYPEIQVKRGVRFVEGEKISDRKSTRLNSSHANISYAVFCLKKTTPPWRRPRTCRRT